MSAQSVTIIPSQPVDSLAQPVSSSLLACSISPSLLEELTIRVSAPASMQALKGTKYFSLSSRLETIAGVRS